MEPCERERERERDGVGEEGRGRKKEIHKAMLMQQWSRLCEQIRCKGDVTTLAIASPEHSYDTLRALFEQLQQRHGTKNFYLLKQHGHDFVRKFNNGETLLQISEWVGLSPVTVARRVVSIMLRTRRRGTNNALRDTSTIAHPRLREEVATCMQVDDTVGPNIDRLRRVLGLEYEHLLLDYLRNLHLEFETESDLRKRNSYKTPDVLLRVPVSFLNSVVCWVDSKAKFADKFTLNKDYEDSVRSYVGRFGPGMVVYWFGFVSDCDSPMLHDDGVLIVDHFPTQSQVHFLPGSQIPQPTQVEVSIVE